MIACSRHEVARRTCPQCLLGAGVKVTVKSLQKGQFPDVPDPSRGDWLELPRPPGLDIRVRSKSALITVVVGDEAGKCFSASGDHMRRFAVEYGYDFHVSDWAGHPAWPMSSKFGVARYLDHYDEVLYADADVLFRPGCVDPLDYLTGEFGACDELPFQQEFPEHKVEHGYHKWLEAAGFSARRLTRYFNAGVYVAAKAAKPLIDCPDRIWVGERGLNNHCAEQHLVNARAAAGDVPVVVLPRTCNWQSWTCRTCGGCGGNRQEFFTAAPPQAVLHWSGAGTRGGRTELIKQAAAKSPWPVRGVT